MTPLADVFSLRLDETLDFGRIARIARSGHTRIPVMRRDGGARGDGASHGASCKLEQVG